MKATLELFRPCEFESRNWELTELATGHRCYQTTLDVVGGALRARQGTGVPSGPHMGPALHAEWAEVHAPPFPGSFLQAWIILHSGSSEPSELCLVLRGTQVVSEQVPDGLCLRAAGLP